MIRTRATRCQLSAFLSMALPLLAATAAASTTADSIERVRVRASLVESRSHGASTSHTRASTVVTVDEPGAITLVAGMLGTASESCDSSSSAGPVGGPDLVDLPAHGVRWRIVASLNEPGADPYRIHLQWTRETLDMSGHQESTTHETDLELQAGESRLLDLAAFEPPNSHPSCRVASYHLEVSAIPVPFDQASSELLRYELWFARTQRGVRQEYQRLELLGGQAEELPFRLSPLRVELPHVPRDLALQLESFCRGYVLAWPVGRDRLAVQLRPDLRHRLRLGDTIGTISSGQGTMLFEVTPGETLEIELPSPMGRFLVSDDGVQVLQGKTVDGVERGDGTFSLDLDKLLAGTTYSLLIRVQPS